MSWYSAGTVNIVKGSKNVNGVGTKWVSNVRVGEGIQIGTSIYEIENVASDGAMSLATPIAEATGTGKTYRIIPFQGYVKQLADKAARLLYVVEEQTSDFGNTILNELGDAPDKTVSQAKITSELEWAQTIIPKAEAEGGTATARRAWSSLRVREAITGWWSGFGTSYGRGFIGLADAEAAREKVGLADAIETEVAPQLTIIYRDAFRDSVEKASGGKNTVIYDAQGKPNVMVVIPRFNCEDVDVGLGTGTHPAFITKGVPRSEIIVGKYLLSDAGVVGGQRPKISQNYDQFKSLIAAKGAGWHMMSAHEWAAIGLWSIANGTIPRGNTNYGRAHDAKWETGVAANKKAIGDSAGANHTLTGSGPASWTHDHTDFGVSDLVGNVWEWVDQYKIVDGQIFCTLDNDPSAPEADWVASGIFMDYVTSKLQYNDSLSTAAGSYSTLFTDVFQGNHELLQRLLAEPTAGTASAGGSVYWNSAGERLPRRGGDWGNGANAGVAALSLVSERSLSVSGIGCRPAYFGS